MRKLTWTATIFLLCVPALSVEPTLNEAVDRVVSSSRVELIGLRSNERLGPAARLAPGDAPLLRFRYLDGRRRHRFGDLDLVMDDAGH